jgi:hypothetical protein
MQQNLITLIEGSGELPCEEEGYTYSGCHYPGEGDLQLFYDSKDKGIFTITLYPASGFISDVYDPLLEREFEDCINAVFGLEDEKIYCNVNLLVKEKFFFEDNEDPFSLSAVFRLQHIEEDGSAGEPVLSFLFLRADMDCFHKIRYSIPAAEYEESLYSMQEFLKKWITFISCLGVKIN